MSTEHHSTCLDEKKEDEWIPLVAEQHPSKEEATVEATEGSASVGSKAYREEINLINDLLPPGVDHQAKVDSSNNDKRTSDPIQKVLQQISKSVEPLRTSLDENVKKLQGAVSEHVIPCLDKAKSVMDEHVKPHIDKAKTTVDENVGKHVKSHIETTQSAFQSLHSQTSKNWEGLSSTTQKLVDEHLKPGLENVKKGTTEGFETVKRSTVEGFDNSKRVLSDLPGHSRRALDQHLLPAMQNVKLETQRKMQTISAKSIQSYQNHVQPQVEKVHSVHAKYKSRYMGRAPGLFDEHESRFYMILVEASLRAFGKVLFCDNPVTGGLIWLAMLVGSPLVALCAVFSVASLTYMANFLNVAEPSVLRKGDFGVNSVLIGAGSAAFFQFQHPIFGWIGSIMMATFILPPITLVVYLHCTRSWIFRSTTDAPAMPTLLIPYNLVMVTFLMTAVLWDRTLLVVPAVETEATLTPHLGTAIMNGLTKVFLVQGVYSGVLVLIGTLLCSRILAGSMVVGSVVATLLGWVIGMPAAALNSGSAGYNAVLTTAAVVYFFEPSWTLVVVGVFVIVVCGLFEAAFTVFFWETLYVIMRSFAGVVPWWWRNCRLFYHFKFFSHNTYCCCVFLLLPN